MSLPVAKRIQYIDRLRGFAVVSMFHVHSAVAWLDPKLKSGNYFKCAMALSGMVAPVFMFLAGISIGLIADKSASTTASADTEVSRTKRKVSLRGLQIWALGYVLHFVFYIFSGHWNNWTRILKVDILHCIGLTMVIAPWIAWPKKRFNVPALLLFTIAPMLSMVAYRLPIIDHVPLGVAAYITIPSRVSLFPVIPYMAWLMLGLFIALPFTHALRDPDAERRFWTGLLIGVVGMWLVGYGLKRGYYALSLHRLGTETPQAKGVLHFFWMKGAVVLGVFALFRLSDKLFNRFPYPFLVLFGRRSLFAYCLHLFVVYPMLGATFRRSLTAKEHLLASLSLSAAMFATVVGWEHLRRRKALRQRRHRVQAPVETPRRTRV